MKVGILSMQRVVNYGSFLQAFALRKILEGMGASCSFIDIKSGQQLERLVNKSCKTNLLKKAFQHFLSGDLICKTKAWVYNRKVKDTFTKSFFDLLGLQHENKDEFYDLVVIGSDEVFNCCQKGSWGFTTHLFGDQIKANKIITYAASCGSTTIKDIDKHELRGSITDALKNVSSISVRDKNTYDMIKEVTGEDPVMHVDPVIIYNFEEYLPDQLPISDYIVVYAYPDSINNKDEIEAIVNYSKSKNKKLVSIGCCYKWCDKAIIPTTPFEVLSYFRHADYVITDTFHGIVFSFKYNKNFCAFARNNNALKITYLLKQFNLESRMALCPSDVKRILDHNADYDMTNRIVQRETEKSIQYISNFIQAGNALHAKSCRHLPSV